MAGIYFAIGAAIIFSMAHVGIRRGVGVLGVTNGVAIMLLSATFIVGLASLLFEGVSLLRQASQAGVMYFAAAGLVHFIAGWSFMNASTRLIGAARMSAVTGITPLFAALLAILTLHEALNVVTGSGIVLIVIGVVFIATG